MRAWIGCGLMVFLAATPGLSQAPEALAPPKEKVLKDQWDTAYLDGHRAGFVRLKVEEIANAQGQPIIRVTQEMNLSVRRGPNIAKIPVLTGSDETPSGQMVAVFMTQGLGQNVKQELHGKVEGNQLVVRAAGPQANFEKKIPWNPKVVSAYGELDLLRKRNPPPKPGDKFDYLTYNPIVNTVVTVHVEIEKYEDTTINTPTGPQRQNLLRVTMVPNEIQGVQLPSQIVWYDSNFEIRKSLANLEGVGFLTTERSTEQLSRQPIAPHLLPDIMERQSIKLTQRIPNAHQAHTLRYRVTLKDRDATTTFAQDNRQTVKVLQPPGGAAANAGNSFELTVRAVRQPPNVLPAGATAAAPEFLSSNYFITSDDPLVKQHAAAAVGAETDPWKKALRIERWVHDNMQVQNFANAMAPAFDVAKNKTGDCTEYSMLATAMCRAVGVPARTAIGVVYVDIAPPRQSFFGFHMWTEVWVNGEWVGIDATLALQGGGIGPAHLKIADHSWDNTRSMTPLLPLMRVMLAQPAIEVLSK